MSLLGQGGMGHVYLAEDLKLKGKKWAVKECLASCIDMESFVEEAEMLAQLHHPQLPQLVDYFSADDGGAYLVMDYVPGPTLQHWFEERHRHVPVTAVVGIAMQLCDLFHYLHTLQPRPIIYRDLKPANVMLGEQEQVRLIDFGIARHFTQGQQADTMQIGTIGFAAPEQFLGKQTDARSDLFTLGAMMYYLLSGGQYAYLKQLPLSQMRSDVPPLLSDTVELLLNERPDGRCQSAMEVKRRLQALGSDIDRAANRASVRSSKTSAPAVADKLIVVGGLYPGVGSTFAAVSIARVLNAAGVPHALAEHPAIEPDLYMLLYGDRKAPKGYVFAAEALADGQQSGSRGAWTNGSTTWVPSDPEGSRRGTWNPADTFKLLHAIKKPIVIWDVSAEWGEPSVQELCHSADEIVVVLDASPGKLNRSRTKAHMQLLETYRKRGKCVRFIANRQWSSERMHQEWLDSLPEQPCGMIPEVPYADVMRAVWKGDCIQDQPGVLRQLQESLAPLLRSIVPDIRFPNPQESGKSIFKRFKKHG